MPKHFTNPKALCPYYHHEDRQMIYCEGVQEGSLVHLAFASNTDARDYKVCRCYQEYQRCHIYIMHERMNKNG